MTEWISVKDKLPDEYEDVICFYDSEISFGYIDMYKDWIYVLGDYYVRGNKITHWMPLPEAPKESDNG